MLAFGLEAKGVNIIPWEGRWEVVMEVEHGCGGNHNATVICIVLVLYDAWYINSRGSIKASVLRVVVAIKCC